MTVTETNPILALDAALSRELSGVQIGRVYPAYEAVREEVERLRKLVLEIARLRARIAELEAMTEATE